MCIAKTMRTVNRQRIFISWRCIFAIKSSLIPVLGVTMKLGVREADIFPFLNSHSTKFSIGSVCKLCTTVQIEEIPKHFNCGFLLKISLAKYLEIANIGHRVWSNVLRMDLEAASTSRKNFDPGGLNPCPR